jgi:hypothetical protein
MAMSKPLREGISEFVIDYVQAKRATGEAIDAAEIAYEMAQSLIDIIMTEEAEGQASLFALVLAGLGEEYLLRSGVLDAGHKIAN